MQYDKASTNLLFSPSRRIGSDGENMAIYRVWILCRLHRVALRLTHHQTHGYQAYTYVWIHTYKSHTHTHTTYNHTQIILKRAFIRTRIWVPFVARDHDGMRFVRDVHVDSDLFTPRRHEPSCRPEIFLNDVRCVSCIQRRKTQETTRNHNNAHDHYVCEVFVALFFRHCSAHHRDQRYITQTKIAQTHNMHRSSTF